VLQRDFEWSRVGFCGQPGCWVKYYALSGQGAWIVVRVYLQRVYVRGSNMTDCKTVHPPARSRAISPSAMPLCCPLEGRGVIIWHIGWNQAGCKGLASDWQDVTVLLTGIGMMSPAWMKWSWTHEWESEARVGESEEFVKGTLEAVEEILKGAFKANLARIRRREGEAAANQKGTFSNGPHVPSALQPW